jgi:hypothetical protein
VQNTTTSLEHILLLHLPICLLSSWASSCYGLLGFASRSGFPGLGGVLFHISTRFILPPFSIRLSVFFPPIFPGHPLASHVPLVWQDMIISSISISHLIDELLLTDTARFFWISLCSSHLFLSSPTFTGLPLNGCFRSRSLPNLFSYVCTWKPLVYDEKPCPCLA